MRVDPKAFKVKVECICVYMIVESEVSTACIHPKAFKTTVLENALDGTLTIVHLISRLKLYVHVYTKAIILLPLTFLLPPSSAVCSHR